MIKTFLVSKEFFYATRSKLWDWEFNVRATIPVGETVDLSNVSDRTKDYWLAKGLIRKERGRFVLTKKGYKNAGINPARWERYQKKKKRRPK